jgi:deoxyxylulose-5-phosphate synthase
VLELAASKTTPGKQKTGDSNILNNIRVLGAPRQFIKHDTRPTQLSQAGINAVKIAQTAKDMLHA